MAFIWSNGKKVVLSTPKKTRQGSSANTKTSPSSNSSRKKPYRGQGR